MENKIPILFEDYCIVDGTMYFPATNFNMICSKRLHEDQYSIIGHYPTKTVYHNRMCGRVFYFKNEIYFPPLSGDSFWVYNPRTQSMRTIQLEKSPNDKYGLFQAVEYQGRLFLFGEYFAIVVIHADGRIDYIRDYFSKLTEQGFAYLGTRCTTVVQGSNLYAAACESNHVLKLNMDTYQYEWIEVGEKGDCFSGICFCKNEFVLAPRNDRDILIWNGSKVTNRIPLPEVLKGSRASFMGAFAEEDRVYFPAFGAEKSLRLNLKTQEMILDDAKYMFYKSNGNQKSYQTAEGIFELYDVGRKTISFLCEMSFSDMETYFLKNTYDWKEYLWGVARGETNIDSLQLFLKAVRISC